MVGVGKAGWGKAGVGVSQEVPHLLIPVSRPGPSVLKVRNMSVSLLNPALSFLNLWILRCLVSLLKLGDDYSQCISSSGGVPLAHIYADDESALI
jgi:hypothetical protein